MSYTPAPSRTSAPGQLSMLSDHTLTLTRAGTTEQIVAPADATYTSTNPAVATVSSTGLITAVSSGMALIQVDEIGQASDAVAVIVATSATSTVGLPSSDVQSVSGNQVVLFANSDTQPIQVGSYVLSGDNAGIIGQVMAISRGSSTLTVTLAAATIVAALPNVNFSEDVDLGTISFPASSARTRGSFTTTPAPTTAPSVSAPPGCSATFGSHFSQDSFMKSYHFELHNSLSTMGGVLNGSAYVTYSLQANTTQDAAISANVSGSCDFPITTFVSPPIVVGSFWFDLTLMPTVGGKFMISATSMISLPLPVVTLGTSGTIGISVANGMLMNATSFGPLMKSVTIKPLPFPANSIFGITATADLKLPVAADVYFAKFIRVTPVTGADLGTLEIDGNFNVTLEQPFSPSHYNYIGPTWEFDISGSYTVPQTAAKIYNAIAMALKSPSIMPNNEIPFPDLTLAQEPLVGLTTSVDNGGCVSLTANATDMSVFPIDYTGDKVNFVASTDNVNNQQIANSVVGTATTWAPPNPGTYMLSAQILAWPYLPYASAPQAITISQAHPACQGLSSGTGPTPSPVPSPTQATTPNPSASVGSIAFDPQALDFPDIGSAYAQNIEVSQSSYTGQWSESDSCSGIATVAGAFVAPASQFTVTPLAPGTCYVNVNDAGQDGSSVGQLQITVETTTVSPNRKGRK